MKSILGLASTKLIKAVVKVKYMKKLYSKTDFESLDKTIDTEIANLKGRVFG